MSQTILVVDDERCIADAAATILENEGFCAVPLYRAAEAIATLRTMNVALILTDVNMPDIDGVELALEAQKVCPRTKVLLMSGAETTESVRQRTGCENCPFRIMAKPFGISELVNMVGDVLN